MLYTALRPHAGRVVLGAVTAVGLLISHPVCAQDDTYHVGENRSSSAHVPPASLHRMARIEYVSGKVTWRPDDAAKWAKAGTNSPLNEGAQLWVEDGGRAEVRFDDGSILRLGSGAVATLQTAYVDAQGEYTRIKMLSGIATLIPREESSVFEVNTPFISVKTVGPSRLRIGVGNDVEVAVSRGRANLEGPQGKITLNTGDFVSERAADTTYEVRSLPAPDSWEKWNDERDRQLAADARPIHHGPSPSRSNTQVFISLGFPLYPAYRPAYHPNHGRGVYHHRW